MVVSSESSKEIGGGFPIVEEVLEEETIGKTTMLETGVEEVMTTKGTRVVLIKVIVHKIKVKRKICGRAPRKRV